MQGVGSQFDPSSQGLAHSTPIAGDQLLGKGDVAVSGSDTTRELSTNSSSFLSSWKHPWTTHDLGMFKAPRKSGRSETSVEAVQSGPRMS